MRILLTIASAHGAAPDAARVTDIAAIAGVRYEYFLRDGIYGPVFKELTGEFKLFKETGDERPLLEELNIQCAVPVTESVGSILQCMRDNLDALSTNVTAKIMPFSKLIDDATEFNRRQVEKKPDIEFREWIKESVDKTIQLVSGKPGFESFDGICPDNDCTEVVTSLRKSFPALDGWFELYKAVGDKLLVSVLLVFAVIFPYHAYAGDTALYSVYTRKLREAWAPDVDFSNVDNVNAAGNAGNVFRPLDGQAEKPANTEADLIQRTKVAVLSGIGGEMKFSQFVVRAAAITRKCLSKTGTMFAQDAANADDLYRGMTLSAAVERLKFPELASAKTEYALHGTSYTTNRTVANFFAEAGDGHSVRMMTHLTGKKRFAVSFLCLKPFEFAEDEIFMMPGLTALPVEYDGSPFGVTTDADDAALVKRHLSTVKAVAAVGAVPPAPDDDAAHRYKYLTVLQLSQIHPVVERFLGKLDRARELTKGEELYQTETQKRREQNGFLAVERASTQKRRSS